MGDIFKLYNKTLKEMIDIIANELPDESLVTDAQRRYNTAILADRTLLLTETGRELFELRDYIADNRLDELINKKWSGNERINVDSKAIQHILTLLRKIWIGYDDHEKKHVHRLFKILLSEYSKYLMSQWM